MQVHPDGRQMSLSARVTLALAMLLVISGVFVSWAAFAHGRQAAREDCDLTPMDTAAPHEAAVMIDTLNRFMARRRASVRCAA